MKKRLIVMSICWLLFNSVGVFAEEDCGCDGNDDAVVTEDESGDEYYNSLVEDGLMDDESEESTTDTDTDTDTD